MALFFLHPPPSVLSYRSPVESSGFSTGPPSTIARRPLRYQQSVFRHRPKARLLRYATVALPGPHIRLLLTRSFPVDFASLHPSGCLRQSFSRWSIVSPLQGCLRQSPERLPSPPGSLRLCAIARVFRFSHIFTFYQPSAISHQPSALRHFVTSSFSSNDPTPRATCASGSFATDRQNETSQLSISITKLLEN
jgi:hypothetical protein